MRLGFTLVVLSAVGCAPQAFVVDQAKAARPDAVAMQTATWPPHVVHRALVDGQWRDSDDDAWRAAGEREAVLDYAARILGCPVAALKADKPHRLWIVDGCAQGVFASVAQWLRPIPPERETVVTELFIDVASEDPARAYDAMLRAVPGGDGEWFVQGDGGDVLRNLERLAAINLSGARDLVCSRSRVAHDVVSLRGGHLTIVEGCARRATYLDDDPRTWRLLSIVDLRHAT
jgi:hypothetical protein